MAPAWTENLFFAVPEARGEGLANGAGAKGRQDWNWTSHHINTVDSGKRPMGRLAGSIKSAWKADGGYSPHKRLCCHVPGVEPDEALDLQRLTVGSECFICAMGLFSATVAFLGFRGFGGLLNMQHFNYSRRWNQLFWIAQCLSSTSDCFQGKGRFTLQK